MSDQRLNTRASRVLISGSLAFDYIMTFPGSLKDHILPEKIHVLSVSFLFDSLKRHRGGVAGNIAYNLALLGESPVVVGAGGSDFGGYRVAFDALGIDTSLILDIEDELTGSAFMTTDLDNNQINGFYPGASGHAATVSVLEPAKHVSIGLVGATSIDAMTRHAREIAAAGCRLIFDPSQQVVAMSADDLMVGIDVAWAVAGSDYEMAIIEKKTGLTIDALAAKVPLLVVTYGEFGSELRWQGEAIRIPAVPTTALKDPTGGGDAYRAGLIKGLLDERELPICGRLGALTATYAIEQQGTQEHAFTADEFVARFDQAFPVLAGELDPARLSKPNAFSARRSA